MSRKKRLEVVPLKEGSDINELFYHAEDTTTYDISYKGKIWKVVIRNSISWTHHNDLIAKAYEAVEQTLPNGRTLSTRVMNEKKYIDSLLQVMIVSIGGRKMAVDEIWRLDHAFGKQLEHIIERVVNGGGPGKAETPQTT